MNIVMSLTCEVVEVHKNYKVVWIFLLDILAGTVRFHDNV